MGGNSSFREEGVGKRTNEKLGPRNSEVVESSQAVVAADDGRCSEIGIYVLEKGGHAFDAAVATALCLGVVNPTYWRWWFHGGPFFILP